MLAGFSGAGFNEDVLAGFWLTGGDSFVTDDLTGFGDSGVIFNEDVLAGFAGGDDFGLVDADCDAVDCEAGGLDLVVALSRRLAEAVCLLLPFGLPLVFFATVPLVPVDLTLASSAGFCSKEISAASGVCLSLVGIGVWASTLDDDATVPISSGEKSSTE